MTRRGFTLIELLVVVSIIGLLSSIIFAALSGARDKGRIAAAAEFDDNLYHLMGDHLVGYWPLGDCSGSTAADRSIGNNPGTITGATWSNSVPLTGSCSLQFVGGGSQYVRTSYIQKSVSQYTISAWVKTTAAQAAIVTDRGVTNDSGVSVTMTIGYNGYNKSNPGTVNCGLDASGVWIGGYTSATVNDGKWHNVVCRFMSTPGSQLMGSYPDNNDDADFTVYIDGVAAPMNYDGLGDANSPVTGSSEGTVIGYNPIWGMPTSGTALISGVRLYDEAF